MARQPIGTPFTCEEVPLVGAISAIGAYIAVVNDPPWSDLVDGLARPRAVVEAGNMDLVHLDSIHDRLAGSGTLSDVTVVGIGGGTALDTAKYLAWRAHLPLVQAPTITSVDAGFTDAIGVRVDGKVRYVGHIVPERVILDVDIIASAPKRLNRAGIGDILSCHTGLHDWRAATDAGVGHPWDDDLAQLADTLLRGLDASIVDIAQANPTGIRFVADAYRQIGAACAAAGHSRFEEGSEHFWAYAYEHATGAHHVHGELIAFATVALAHVQLNDPAFAHRIVSSSGVVAHPADLDIDHAVYVETLLGLRDYARAEGLDVGVADLCTITRSMAEESWEFASSLPRRTTFATGPATGPAIT